MQMTATRAPQMTAEERAATVAYHADLVKQFDANATNMWDAKGQADLGRYNECVEETRRLYREIKEAEYALEHGVLPF